MCIQTNDGRLPLGSYQIGLRHKPSYLKEKSEIPQSSLHCKPNQLPKLPTQWSLLSLSQHVSTISLRNVPPANAAKTLKVLWPQEKMNKSFLFRKSCRIKVGCQWDVLTCRACCLITMEAVCSWCLQMWIGLNIVWPQLLCSHIWWG